jgi:hypothetical protein
MKLTLILSSMFLACSMHAQTIKELQSEIVQLQKQVATLQANKALALAPFVTVDPSPENNVRGVNIVFHDANVHIVNGAGQTDIVNGLGNLIIGYDETDQAAATQRTGSHSLIIGRHQRWEGFSNLICGEYNTANNLNNLGYGQFVAGFNNQTFSQYSSVLGGSGNGAGAEYSVVVGGGGNGTGAPNSVVLGGQSNLEYGQGSVTLGGAYHTDIANPAQYQVTQ